MQRRRFDAGKTFKPTGIPVPMTGLSDMSVLDAAVVDGEDIPWRVAGVAPGYSTYHGGRSDLFALMEQCLDSDPTKRPSLNDVQITLRAIPQ